MDIFALDNYKCLLVCNAKDGTLSILEARTITKKIIFLHSKETMYVVYFDQRPGASHHVHWLKYFFALVPCFSHFEVKEGENEAKKKKKQKCGMTAKHCYSTLE